MNYQPNSSEWQKDFNAVLAMVLAGEYRGMGIPCPGVTAEAAAKLKEQMPNYCPFTWVSERPDLEWQFFPYSRRGPILFIYPAGTMSEREAFTYAEGYSVN